MPMPLLRSTLIAACLLAAALFTLPPAPDTATVESSAGARAGGHGE